MWVFRARCAQVWMVVKLSGEISTVVGDLLCSKIAIPVWHRWILSLPFQTICLLKMPRCLHCCPQRNDFPPSDVSGQQSLDVRSWPSCEVPFVYGEVVFSPQCTNMWNVFKTMNQDKMPRIQQFFILMRKLYDLRNIYLFYNWINRLFTEENMVPRTLFEARNVAGSTKNKQIKQDEIVFSFKVRLLIQFIQSWKQRESVTYSI